MRRNKLTNAETRSQVTYTCYTFTSCIHNGNSWPDVREITIYCGSSPEFSYEDVLIGGYEESTWSMEIIPLCFEFTFVVKYLHAVAFSVSYVDVAVFVRGNVMG